MGPRKVRRGGREQGDGGAALERRQLLNAAYRLLGSVAESEDAVQEAYTRWYALPRARRERYAGAWPPDPLPDRTEWGHGPSAGLADTADQMVLDESVTTASLVVLESMTPAERVAFVLHDVFRSPFADIAAVLGRNPAACEQLAASARRRLRAARAPVSVSADGRADAVRQVKEAWESKDIAVLVDLLDPVAVMTADGGGLAGAALRPSGRSRAACASPGGWSPSPTGLRGSDSWSGRSTARRAWVADVTASSRPWPRPTSPTAASPGSGRSATRRSWGRGPALTCPEPCPATKGASYSYRYFSDSASRCSMSAIVSSGIRSCASVTSAEVGWASAGSHCSGFQAPLRSSDLGQCG